MKTISYNPPWKKLVRNGCMKRELQQKTGTSTDTVANLGCNENVTTATIVKVAETLDRGLKDIVEIAEDEKGDPHV